MVIYINGEYDKERHWHLTLFKKAEYNQKDVPNGQIQEQQQESLEYQFRCIENVLKSILNATQNTIPFILYCDNGQPFKATCHTTATNQTNNTYTSLASFIFIVKEIKNRCAVLELITTKSKMSTSTELKISSSSENLALIDQLNYDEIGGLVKTGLCTTVELDCFCGVTCLPGICL
jgi:hypothetical protein